jgi:[ribosomal protein S5]-alanine N-acetyltransferase
MFFPDLTTDRLLLRGVRESDVGFLFDHLSDSEVCRYLYDAEPYTTIDEAEGLIQLFIDPEGKTLNRWIIVEKESGEPIGTCGYSLWDKENNRAEIGYDLGPAYWNRGFMTEALTAALTSGFGNMSLNRVEAVIALENVGSSRLVEKLGFEREGVMRDRHLFRGTYYDHYLYSLLAREWIRAPRSANGEMTQADLADRGRHDPAGSD